MNSGKTFKVEHIEIEQYQGAAVPVGYSGPAEAVEGEIDFVNTVRQMGTAKDQ